MSFFRDLHPFSLAFVGFSGSGKTTLLESLVGRMNRHFRIGYIKHDAHHFEMDQNKKDTARLRHSGARRILINDAEKTATLGAPLDFSPDYFEDCDFVFIEGYKNSPLEKIAFLDADGKMLDKIKSGEVENVIATVEEKAPQNTSKLPSFSRDDVKGIQAFVLNHFSLKHQNIPVKGLVLTGGRSKRMKKDKSQLVYHDKPQVEVAHDLLKKHCDEVFISCRSDQKYPYPRIHDRLLDMGPMGGILSAMLEHPHCAWWVLACDLPLLDDKTMLSLFKSRDPFKIATCYASAHDTLPEPLCAIYEPHSFKIMFRFMGLKIKCPRKILINSNTKVLELDNSRALDNCNYVDEYESLVQELKK